MGKICVSISSEAENKIIQSFLFSNGVCWRGDKSTSHREIDRMYGDKTILCVKDTSLSYSDTEYAEGKRETILSPSDFITYAQDNLIPREVI